MPVYRAQFNDVATVVRGPLGAPPNTVKFVTACRYIAQTRIIKNSTFLINNFAYITLIPTLSITAGVRTLTANGYTMNTRAADRILLASAPGLVFVVCYMEDVYEGGLPVYARAFVVQMGLPGFPP